MKFTIASMTVLAGLVFAIAQMPPDNEMRQDSFPCMEDEVLGYDPKFGPDHVGCIHIEDVR